MSVFDDALDVGDWIGNYLSSPIAWVSGPAGILGAAGLFGEGYQDFVTMGKSAQKRAQEDALDAQRKAQEEAAKIRREQNRQQYIQQIRAARIQRARTAANTVNEAGISSGAQGALSSIGSQLSRNIQYMQYQTDISNKILGYENIAGKRSADAAKYGSYYDQGMSAIKMAASALALIPGGLPVGATAGSVKSAVQSVGGSQVGMTAAGNPIYDVTGTATTGGNVRFK